MWTLRDKVDSLIDAAVSKIALGGDRPIYEISWEDARIDRRVLNLSGDDRVFCLCSAGCNILEYVIEGVEEVVAIDMNPAQIALLDLRCAVAQVVDNHDEYFRIFGESDYQALDVAYHVKGARNNLQLQESRDFWDQKLHLGKDWMSAGTSGMAAKFFIHVSSRLFGLKPFFDEVRRPGATRESIAASFAKHQNRFHAHQRFYARMMLPFLGVLQGVPAKQSSLESDLCERFCRITDRIGATDLSKNFFYRGYILGHFERDCCPRWLEEANFEKMRTAHKHVTLKIGMLHRVVSSYPDNYFTVGVLLDHQDWLENRDILNAWGVFARVLDTNKGRVLWRSFAEELHPTVLGTFLRDVQRVQDMDCRVCTYGSTWMARPPVTHDTIVPRRSINCKRTWTGDLKVLSAMALNPIIGKGVEHFYSMQSGEYDAFREDMLVGRPVLAEHLQVCDGKKKVWVDVGGGTGSSIERMLPVIRGFDEIVLVDLSPSLLAVAMKRFQDLGIADRVRVVEADWTDLAHPASSKIPKEADIVTFSYSLTMIPQWREAVNRAVQMLAPRQGTLAVADFTVDKHRSALWNTAVKTWFSGDGVYLTEEHEAYITKQLGEPTIVQKFDGALPYIPWPMRAHHHVLLYTVL